MGEFVGFLLGGLLLGVAWWVLLKRYWARGTFLAPWLGRVLRGFGQGGHDKVAGLWPRLGEIGVVGLGAWLSAGMFLSFDPALVPSGREFLSTIHYYHFWNWIRTCGGCAFWAPFGGGFPILGDPMPGLLYPPAAFPVLLWGVVNGIKVAIFLSFFSAGLAVWWQGWLWRLRPGVRLWGAWMVMASGMISGRLELGDVHTVLSLGALAWVFPAWWYAWQRNEPWAWLPLAWAFGWGMLAARGYHLFGTLMAWGTLVLLMGYFDATQRERLWRNALQGLFGAMLLAAPVLLPLIRMMPHMVKETDVSFHTTQRLSNLMFNFLIADPDFYRSTVLDKLAYPHLTFFFIGWIPFLLAGYALVAGYWIPVIRQRKLPLGWTGLWAFLLIWLATGQPLRGLIAILPWSRAQEFLAGFRHIEQVAALAVVPMVTLSMVGVESLLHQMETTTFQVQGGTQKVTLSLQVLLWIVLLLPLRTGWQLGKHWMFLSEALDVRRGLAFLAQGGYGWVDAPFGEHFWVEPAVARGLKIRMIGIARWRWRHWEYPPPQRALSRHLPEETEVDEVVEIEEGLYGLVFSDVAYAFWEQNDGTRLPCEATGWGGAIEVRCPEGVQAPGRLWVMEKSWPGWWAWVEGRWRRLKPEARYLTVSLDHPVDVVRLRFIPEASLLGFGLALGWIGWQIRLAWRLWHKGKKGHTSPSAA